MNDSCCLIISCQRSRKYNWLTVAAITSSRTCRTSVSRWRSSRARHRGEAPGRQERGRQDTTAAGGDPRGWRPEPEPSRRGVRSTNGRERSGRHRVETAAIRARWLTSALAEVMASSPASADKQRLQSRKTVQSSRLTSHSVYCILK